MMTPKDLIGWIKWKFKRYNGPPFEYTLDELRRDCEYDLLKHVDLDKKSLSTELVVELNNLVDNGYLTKKGETYTGDHYREDSKAYQELQSIDEEESFDSEMDVELYVELIEKARSNCRNVMGLPDFKRNVKRLGLTLKSVLERAESKMGKKADDWELDEWFKFENSLIYLNGTGEIDELLKENV